MIVIYTENSYTDISNGKIISNIPVDYNTYIPMSSRIGISYTPELGDFNSKINPTITTDYRVLLSDKLEDYDKNLIGDKLSIGLDIKFFSFLSLRGGLNQGYLSLGLGLDVGILELNSALYSKEAGRYAGDKQQMGAIIEFAIKI